MAEQRSHTKAGILFVVICALVGIALFAITNINFAARDNNNQVSENLSDVPLDDMKVATDSPPQVVDLSEYAGRYPSDASGGTAFMDNTAVRSALVGAMGGDKKLGIFGRFRVEIPIEVAGDQLRVSACEASNCGNRYTILMARDGTSAQVCFQDSGSNGDGKPYWYADGGLSSRADDCPGGGATARSRPDDLANKPDCSNSHTDVAPDSAPCSADTILGQSAPVSNEE